MNKELKPCPFCGGEAKIEQTGKTRLTIKCTRCHTKRDQKWLRYGHDWLESKMIEAWNTRKEWIPVETPPENDTWVDVWRLGERLTDIKYIDGKFKYAVLDKDGDIDYFEVIEDVSHWMPIPTLEEDNE